MAEPESREMAAEYFRRAYQRQMEGDLDQALDLYGRSIKAYPTAEAYTFRGWTYSMLGDHAKAIRECLEAIKVDPDFGNPYNDIGAYLIEQGKLEEAVPWLERAIRAPRYEARGYPYFNLGRIYERKRDWRKAEACYRQALAVEPRYKLAHAALRRLQSQWN